MTAYFRVLYVFVVMEVGTRRIVQLNVTAHPLRPGYWSSSGRSSPGRPVSFPHSRPRQHLLAEAGLGTERDGPEDFEDPYRAPQANSYCERLVGSIRRDCLDFLIPLNEGHLRRTLKLWVDHYNRGPSSLWRGASNGRDWHRRIELCAMVGAVLADADGIYDPMLVKDRLLLGLKGPWPILN